MSSKEILLLLTELFTSYLDELTSLPSNDFIQGEMTAYVECLEIISCWDYAPLTLKDKLKLIKLD